MLTSRLIVSTSLFLAYVVGVGACVSEHEYDEDLGELAQAVEVIVMHSKLKGQSAGVGFSSELVSASLDVSEADPTAILDFDLRQFDPTSQVCTTTTYIDVNGQPQTFTDCRYTRFALRFGFGSIPSADFKAQQGGALLDTVLDSTFNGQTCTVDATDPDNFIFNCTPGVTGRITIHWSKNGVESSSFKGWQKSSFGRLSQKSTGEFSAVSADASGTILGVVGTGKNNAFIQTVKLSSSTKDVISGQ